MNKLLAIALANPKAVTSGYLAIAGAIVTLLIAFGVLTPEKASALLGFVATIGAGIFSALSALRGPALTPTQTAAVVLAVTHGVEPVAAVDAVSVVAAKIVEAAAPK